MWLTWSRLDLLGAQVVANGPYSLCLSTWFLVKVMAGWWPVGIRVRPCLGRSDRCYLSLLSGLIVIGVTADV